MIIRSVLAIVLLASNWCQAANYTLEITQPQPSLNTNSRYYKTYPGIPYEVPIVVFGGMYPFTYELTTAPSGMEINQSTGIISWTNPVTSGSPHSVSVRVTDAESSTDTVSWTLTVSTTNTVFVDCSAETSGTGTDPESPFNALSDVHLGTRDDNTYQGYQMILRAGTCDLQNMSYQGSTVYSPPTYYQDAGVQWSNAKPLVWIGYPGETVVIDHDLNMGGFGYAFRVQDGSPVDLFIQNIKFQDATNHFFRVAPTTTSRNIFYDNVFEDIGPGGDGANSSQIMFTSALQSGAHYYSAVINNTFTDGDSVAFLKTYSTTKLVIDGNSFELPINSCEGVALKAFDTYTSVRNNTFDGDFTAGSICGNMNSGGDSAGNYDISFNNIKNADVSGDALTYGGLNVNHDGTITGPIFVYRNTIEGAVQYRGQSPDVIHFDNNVIINDMSAVDSPDGSLLHPWPEAPTSDSSVLDLGTGDEANLVGSTSSGIIDSSGNLTGEYVSYVGTKGYQISSAPATTTCYPDADSDTYGDSSDAGEARETCEAGEVENNTDCDDTDAAIHPGTTDICGNSIDEDCSGTDATCPTPGVTWYNIGPNGYRAAVE